ncbi:pheromone A receptor-domain-containing protein [Mycena latifolia]|nr:pheromone A receptor-domain-containing protein [Mycena latifolia]
MGAKWAHMSESHEICVPAVWETDNGRVLYHIACVRASCAPSSLPRPGTPRSARRFTSLPALPRALRRRAVTYIVQGHHFDIFQDVRCYPVLDNSLAAYFISSMWPVLTFARHVLSLRAFTSRRAAFTTLLSAHSALTPFRYLRLTALSLLTLTLTPLAFTILATPYIDFHS